MFNGITQLKICLRWDGLPSVSTPEFEMASYFKKQTVENMKQPDWLLFVDSRTVEHLRNTEIRSIRFEPLRFYHVKVVGLQTATEIVPC